MKVYMFKPRFAPLVELGIKRQTVRPKRKRPTRPGDMLSLREWTGRPYASKQRELRKSECIAIVEDFAIDEQGNFFMSGSVLGPALEELFAIADGFEDKADMLKWFTKEHGLPFTGAEVVYWSPTAA